MTMELLQRVRVLDPVSETDEISDVLIAEGEIKAIGSPLRNIPQEAEALDCQGLVLAPGLVDLYSHNSEPGNEDRETLSTLVAAAAAGGFTRLGILPDTVPPVDNPGSLAWLQQRSRGAGEAEGKTDQSFSFAPEHLGTSSLLTPHFPTLRTSTSGGHSL